MEGERDRLGVIVPVLIAGGILALDQLTKAIAVDAIGPSASDHRRELLGSVLAFEYVENQGAAFGLLRGQGGLLILIAAVLLATLVAYYRQAGRASILISISLGCLVGGALGNVIDRIRLGHVVDFIAVGIWPKFNVADSAVSIGVALLAWHLYQSQGRTHPGDTAGLTESGDGILGRSGRRFNEVTGHDAGRP